MTRFRNSWDLAKTSWAVLRSDKTLAVFPIVGGLISLVLLVIFAGLAATTGGLTDDSTEGFKTIGYVFAAIGYVVLAFVSVYFQAALVAAADIRLRGDDATVGAGFSAATGRIYRILPWAIVVATVSIILQWLEDRGFLGVIVARLLGAAWSILTFLTIPVIVLEDVGPVTALKRSGSLLKQTWGENIIAQIGIGLLGFLLAIPGVIVIAIGIAIGGGPAVVTGIVVGGAWLVVVTVVMSALSGIYKTALYRYVVDGTAPAAFAGVDMAHAFGARPNRTRGFSGN
jgi:Family of unknown function (DUF6159)